MKKLLLIVLVISTLILTMCKSEEEQSTELQQQIVAMRKELEVERTELAELKALQILYVNEAEVLIAIKENLVCVIDFEIKQGTFSLDIGEHLKNKMNSITISVPVDPEFYMNVNVGDKISNELKWGSLLFNGDFSRLNITVKNKYTVDR
jgi:hypothetical protein